MLQRKFIAHQKTASSGTYYIKGTDNNGCYSISSVEVKVNPTPTVVTISSVEVVPPANADLTGAEITLGSSTGLSYSYWLDALASIPYTTPNFAGAGSYYIKGTNDLTGCYAIAGPVNVTVNTTEVPVETTNELNIYSNSNIILYQ